MADLLKDVSEVIDAHLDGRIEDKLSAIYRHIDKNMAYPAKLLEHIKELNNAVNALYVHLKLTWAMEGLTYEELTKMQDDYKNKCAPLTQDMEQMSIQTGSTPLSRLDLSPRVHNALLWAGIKTIEKLRSMDQGEVMRINRIGKGAIFQIHEAFKDYDRQNRS